MWHPAGLSFGFDVGIGGMEAESGPLECAGCDYSPAAGGFGANIGLQLGPRLSLRADLRATAQTLDADGTAYLIQTTFMAVAQYWVSPRLWVAGGLGGANLSIDIDDGFGGSYNDDLGSGGATMLGIGYELVRSRAHRRRGRMPFAIDLHFRFTTGTYDGLNDQIYSGIVGVGFQWYSPRRAVPPPM
jgi:hypothetical protein